MAATANTAQEETQSLIAFAESYEGQGDIDRAAFCWVNLIAHYRQVVCEEVSAAMDSDASTSLLGKKISAAGDHAPAGFTKEFNLVSKAMTASFPVQFSTLAPAEPDVQIGAEEYAAASLHKLLEHHADYRPHYEERAEQALKDAGNDANARLQAIVVYPGSQSRPKNHRRNLGKEQHR